MLDTTVPDPHSVFIRLYEPWDIQSTVRECGVYKPPSFYIVFNLVNKMIYIWSSYLASQYKKFRQGAMLDYI